jgi:hypothetical protein
MLQQMATAASALTHGAMAGTVQELTVLSAAIPGPPDELILRLVPASRCPSSDLQNIQRAAIVVFAISHSDIIVKHTTAGSFTVQAYLAMAIAFILMQYMSQTCVVMLLQLFWHV